MIVNDNPPISAMKNSAALTEPMVRRGSWPLPISEVVTTGP
ncbi:MAG TPA: hypothetical protein VFN67_01410 [Polyangiales bacterium]|nr:hypothetical protein [Polyangiales bacterium]